MQTPQRYKTKVKIILAKFDTMQQQQMYMKKLAPSVKVQYICNTFIPYGRTGVWDLPLELGFESATISEPNF